MEITQSTLCYFSISGPGDDLIFILQHLHHDWILETTVNDEIHDILCSGLFSFKDTSWYQAPRIYPYYCVDCIFPSPLNREQFSTVIEQVWTICNDNNLLKYFLPVDVRLFQ